MKPDHSKLAELWRWLTEPPDSIVEPGRRRQERMLAALLVFIVPAILVVSLVSALLDSQGGATSDPGLLVAIVLCVLLVFAYSLNRAGRYEQAAVLTVVLQSLAVFAVSVAGSDGGQWLVYLVVPVVIASVLLPLRAAGLFTAVSSLAVWLLAFMESDNHLYTAPAGFISIISGLILVAAHHRNLLERERRAQLARLEQRFSQIFHAAPIATGITTLAEGRIVDVNEQFLKLFGYQRDELIGRLTSEVHIWGEPALRERVVTALRERGSMNSVELQLRTRSGKLLDILMSVQLIELDGVPCMLAMGVDITQLKQADKEHRERERIEIALGKERELGEIKRRFLTTAAHEFRTPLAIILASSELLELYLDRLTPERRASNFATIRAQVMSLGVMLDDMRTILDVEAGSVQFDPAPHDLSRLCQEMVSEVRGTLGIKHTLLFSAEGDLSAIPVDMALFERIVKNLLSNAIKFSPPESEIRVTLCREGDSAVLKVSDDGMGIPQADQPRIFDPYHRAENAFNIPGIGLGLKIVRDFVRLHGGSVTFTSEEGKGTTFTVELPVGNKSSYVVTG